MIRTLTPQLGLSLLALGATLTTTAVAATAPQCAVTFHVHVPASTGTVYLSGNVPALGPWAADKVTLTGTGTDRTAVLKVPEGTHLQFKFTQGAWTSVETTASGQDVANRTYIVPAHATATYTGTVQGWHPKTSQ